MLSSSEIKISIVIPLYNKQDLIVQCLQSVIEQSEAVDEVIIVNDGSTDDSKRIVQQYIYDKPIFTLIDQVNSGVSVARNNGIDNASFEYVALLDADDKWCHDHLKTVKKLIQDYPDAYLYSVAHQVNDYKLGLYIPRTNLPSDFRGYIENFFDASKKYSIANSSKVVFKKISFSEFFPEDAVLGEDLFCWIKFALSYKVAFDSNVTVTINQKDDESRHSRDGKVSYPIQFYSEPENIKHVTPCLEAYLFNIHLNHLLGSLARRNDIEYKMRLDAGKILFPSRFIFLYFLGFMPKSFYTILRIIKRKAMAVKRILLK